MIDEAVAALWTVTLSGVSYAWRRAAPGDLRSLVDLYGADPVSASRGDWAGDADDLREYRRGFDAVAADPHQLLVVVVRTGAGGTDTTDGAALVVGTLQLSFVPGVARRGAWRGQVESVQVAASERGRGLGTALVTWAVDECRRRGCGLVQLTSAVEREDAHRFYERLGFTASHVGFKRLL